jgi:hypothetical protein
LEIAGADVGLLGPDLSEPRLPGMKVVEHDAQTLRVSWAAGGGERRDYLRRAATRIDFRFG